MTDGGGDPPHFIPLLHNELPVDFAKEQRFQSAIVFVGKTISWNLRKFADSSNGSEKVEKAVWLAAVGNTDYSPLLTHNLASSLSLNG
jgi:hypothetical protein